MNPPPSRLFPRASLLAALAALFIAPSADAGWVAHGHGHVIVTRPVVRPRPVVVRPAPVVVRPAPVVVRPRPIVVAPAPVVHVHPAPVTVQVQARLKALGYYGATVDGIAGPATSTAIAGFQQDHGLAVTGTINPALLHALGVR